MANEPAFSRTNRTGDELAELRVNSPRFVLAIVDSVATAETKSTGKLVSRSEIVNRLLLDYAKDKINEANLIKRVLQDNPTVLDDHD